MYCIIFLLGCFVFLFLNKETGREEREGEEKDELLATVQPIHTYNIKCYLQLHTCVHF